VNSVLVTGGAGFLGSHFIRHVLDRGCDRVVNVDLLTYAGDTARLAGVADDPRYRFVRADVASRARMREVLEEHRPARVVHFAAESHVTRSETDPEGFYRTNVDGTRSMLEASLGAGVGRFVHISTDEVYGPAIGRSFAEDDKAEGDRQATSPYAKSKALADDVARAFAGMLDVVVIRPTNCFGPWQFPEKAFARWVTRALSGQPVPVWGDGLQVRQWMAAEDLARAVAAVLETPDPERVYNVGVTHAPEITNVGLARWILGQLGLPASWMAMTAYDRPDHDRRYAVEAQRIRSLGWEPGDVWASMAAAVDWYRRNRSWWEPLTGVAESIYSRRGA
jgi:dTDP-glucose 4,6-dehydratase